MSSPLAVLSVDLEWFIHTPAYRSARGSTDRETIGQDGLEFLLDALEDHDATATFFVVSEIADTEPDILRDIAEAGHEIASHTRTHRLLSTLDETQRMEEIHESRRMLETVTGETVTGFRAPAFEMPDKHFTQLARAGYEYDSSVAPCRHVPGWYGGEHSIQRPAPATAVDRATSTDLMELPVGVMPGLRLPLSGAWLRFFGTRYTTFGMKALADRDITPILYVHPWELVDLPDVDGVPRRVYWRTGGWTRTAIERILSQSFAFVSARTAVDRGVDA